MFANMETVEHDVGVRQPLSHRLDERRPQVDRRRLDLPRHLGRKALEQLASVPRRAPLDPLEDPAPSKVVEGAHIALRAQKTLLIQPDTRDRCEIPFRKSSAHGAVHDLRRPIPAQPEQLSRPFEVGCKLENLDGKGLKQQGESGVLSCPRHGSGFHPAALTAASGCPRAKPRLKLHGIELPPLSHRRVVGDRARGPALRARDPSAAVLKLDLNAGPFQVQFDLHDLPVRIQAQQQTVRFLQ